MTLASIALRNVGRNKLRAVLTMLGIATTIVAFVLLRTIFTAWSTSAEYAAKDRITTRNKVTFIVPLPKRYIEAVRNLPGVVSATHVSWFGGNDPKNKAELFGSLAVESQTFLSVFDEFVLPPADQERWLRDRRGVLVGDLLARRRGWKIGDTITLIGTLYSGEWQFQIDGIYTTRRKVGDRSSIFLHWDYINESLKPGDRRRDHVGYLTSRIADPSAIAAMSRVIDKLFTEREIQTVSMSERAVTLSFLGMVSAVLKALDVVSAVILIIMVLILGNTIAMGARERTREFGVMRAMGFLPRHIALSVLAEALVIGGLGGVLGVLLSYPLVERGVGSWLEENMGSFFPFFQIDPMTAGTAVMLALGLGLLAGLIPAYLSARLNIIDSLRKVG